MKTAVFGKKTYPLDPHGYLDRPELWDRAFAEGMSRSLGMKDGLSGRHWTVIEYIRDYVDEKKDIPFLHQACRDLGLSLEEMRDLFPPGYHRGAFRIAGLSHRFMADVNIWFTYETTALKRDRTPTCPLGFLKDPGKWSREFAEKTAGAHGIQGGLTEKHWQVVRSIRAYFDKTGRIPLVCEICERNALTLHELMELFPLGYHRGACKIAGLHPRT